MVEGTGLENRHAGNGIEGSNPSLSARREVVMVLTMAISLLDEKDANPKEGSEFCQIYLICTEFSKWHHSDS